MRRFPIGAATLIAGALLAGTPAWSADWLTDGGNPQRTAWQRDEKTLTTANVKDMKLLWKLKLDNQPRVMHSLFPPLIIGRLNTAAGRGAGRPAATTPRTVGRRGKAAAARLPGFGDGHSALTRFADPAFSRAAAPAEATAAGDRRGQSRAAGSRQIHDRSAGTIGRTAGCARGHRQ